MTAVEKVHALTAEFRKSLCSRSDYWRYVASQVQLDRRLAAMLRMHRRRDPMRWRCSECGVWWLHTKHWIAGSCDKKPLYFGRRSDLFIKKAPR